MTTDATIRRLETHLPAPTRDFDALEFALVIAIAFGLSIASSLSAALSYQNEPVVFGDFELIATIVFELISAAIVWLVLRRRHWQWNEFAVHASRGATILGIVLALGILGVWELMELVMGKIPSEVTASLASATVLSVLNPVYEEVLVLGYVVQSMRKRFGLFTAMNVSLAIRLLYHLYQGPLVVMPIAILGLVMTLVYVRLGRLWPAIVAHGILDFVALSGLVE